MKREDFEPVLGLLTELEYQLLTSRSAVHKLEENAGNLREFLDQPDELPQD